MSISAAQQAKALKDVREQLASTEAECLGVSRENVQLASQVLQLAEDSEKNKAIPPSNVDASRELERMEMEVKTSRQKWKLMKGTASAVVAGSGVDWSRSKDLRDIVLDPE